MNEQKITPKKSEAGIEYIREMRLAGGNATRGFDKKGYYPG